MNGNLFAIIKEAIDPPKGVTNMPGFVEGLRARRGPDRPSAMAEKIEFRAHATRLDDLPGYWANGQFWEELVELNAYIVLLFAAYIFAEIYRSSMDSLSRP